MKPAYIDKTVEVEGKTLALTKLNKVLYPKANFTKADIFDYYTKVSAVMLPHLRKRMLTLKRYPDGTAEKAMFFYEKRCPSYKPSWMKTKRVKSTGGKEDIHYCEIDNLPGILWAANLASIEFHVLLSLVSNIHCPTAVVFDLDPGEGQSFHNCCRIALRMRDFFTELSLKCFPKTSGGKGLHFYIPVNNPKITFDETKQFAHRVALLFAEKFPGEMTASMKKIDRKGKIFVDWSQNDSHKTTVCVYSLRARDYPTVSTPLQWEEVEKCAKTKNDSAYSFRTDKTLARVKKYGDLFSPVLTLKQKLPKV